MGALKLRIKKPAKKLATMCPEICGFPRPATGFCQCLFTIAPHKAHCQYCVTGAVSRIAAVVALVVVVHIVAAVAAVRTALGIAAVRSLGFALGFVGFRYPKKYTALTGLGG